MSDPTEESLYAWQVFDADEQWGAIAGMVPGFPTGPAPFIFRSRKVAEYVRPIALRHGQGANRPVRLARYVHAETLEEVR